MTEMYYPFNFNGRGPAIGEITTHADVLLKVSFVAPLFITYKISARITGSKYEEIQGPVEILMLSTSNPAHSLGEFMSFLEYYTAKEHKLKVCINTVIAQKMPYLYQLIELFIPSDKRLLINADKSYKFNSVITRRNHHFIPSYKRFLIKVEKSYNFNSIITRRNHHFINVTCWEQVPFSISGKIMSFTNLQYLHNMYSVDCSKLFNKAREIYKEHHHKYELAESIMMIKTTKEKLSVSIQRAIEYPASDVCSLLEKHNVKMLEVSQFRDIYEYICTIYHAKNIVFSYGGPMCINRFFCNPSANVIVLANLHYRPEYEYNNETKLYWHIRHAMLAPVQSQHFLLDFENRLTLENTNQILSLLS